MRNLKLQTKLLIICTFLLAITLGVGLASYISNNKISSSYGSVVSQSLPKEKHINEVYKRFLEIRMNLRNFGLPGLPAEENAKSAEIVLKDLEDIKRITAEYEALGFTPGQKELYQEQMKAWDDFLAVGGRVLALHKTGTPEDIQAMVEIFFTDCPKTADLFTAKTNALLAYHKEVIGQSTTEAKDAAANGLTINIATVSAGVLLGMIFAFIFSKSLASGLNSMSERISAVAQKTADESEQLSTASMQLSSGSTQAAASLEETVASLEELSSMVRLNSSHAQEANGLSQSSKDAAEKGEVEISKLIDSMSVMASGSKKIEEIINVIDDIAFQTNLLALNAAVEAARAGEQGKGFAVVAEAVRTLAQRSSSAAKDISHLIRENVEKSEHGAKIAGSSGAVLKEILVAVKKVADLNSEIAAGSKEQASGLEQISKAMNQLDQATQGNAASSEEVAASSSQVAQQGTALSTLVVELDHLVNGKSAA